MTRKLIKAIAILFRPPLWAPLLRGTAAGTEHIRALRHLKMGTCLDVGANTGQFSVLVRHMFPDADIIAFEPLPEADAIVSTSFFKSGTLELPDVPEVERVIGAQEKAINANRDEFVPTKSRMRPPPRYDDHYGFNSLSCIEY